jgi:hypothetical protein
MFSAMLTIQVVRGNRRDARVRRRAEGGVRRTAVLFGAVALTAGAGLLSAGSALAGSGSQPGKLILTPTSGATKLRPTWYTTDGCPTGYRGAAEMVGFKPNGTFGSRISPTVINPTTAFHGTLDGTVAQILLLGTHTAKGQTSELAIGCYSGIGGTGRVKYIQSTFITLSPTGSSYSTKSTGGSSSASAEQVSGSANGQQASSSANGQQVSPAMHAESASAKITRGVSPLGVAALIAGACAAVVASVGIAWHRRRNRSRLM